MKVLKHLLSGCHRETIRPEKIGFKINQIKCIAVFTLFFTIHNLHSHALGFRNSHDRGVSLI